LQKLQSAAHEEFVDTYITNDLIETTYLFCYKRLSDRESAMDLAQDIICEALKVMRSGTEIRSFCGWYWRMARNKYADYIRYRADPALPIEYALGIAAEKENTLDSLVSDEEITELNQVLSRLAQVHRDIVIRYYLRQESVAQIAAELHIPQGTVKGRLFDARKNVKERLIRMKERTSKPERTGFVPLQLDCYFGGYAGDAISALQKTFAAQTAIACRREKKSVNEIADEIKAAPVYIEDTIKEMISAGILTEVSGGKYLTAFSIFSPYTIDETIRFEKECCAVHHIPEKLFDILMSVQKKITSLDFYGNDFNYHYLLWYLSVLACQQLAENARTQYELKSAGKHEAGVQRDFHISAQYFTPGKKEEPLTLLGDSIGWSFPHDQKYTPEYGRTEYQTAVDIEPFPNTKNSGGEYFVSGRGGWVGNNYVALLIGLSEQPDKQLNDHEMETVAYFIRQGLVSKTDGILHVNLPVIRYGVYEKMKAVLSEALAPLAHEYVDLVGARVEELLLPDVRKDLLGEFYSWDIRNFFDPVHEVVPYGMNTNNVFEIPADYNTSTAGLCILRA
jgi:RNA polymerase sigma factor (sigma-70 family)